MKTRAVIIALVVSNLVLGCLLSCLLGYFLNWGKSPRYDLRPYDLRPPEEYELNKARAQPIISALETYLQLHGTYPDILDDLVPDLLESVPPTIAGAAFEYLPYTSAGLHTSQYMLSFERITKPDSKCVHDSWLKATFGDGFWDCALTGHMD